VLAASRASSSSVFSHWCSSVPEFLRAYSSLYSAVCMYFYVSVHLIFHARLFSLLRNVITTNIHAQAMLPSGARFLALDELDPSTQFCADPEVHFRML